MVPYILYNLAKKAGTLVLLYLRKASKYVGTYRQKLDSLRTFAFNKKLVFLIVLNRWSIIVLNRWSINWIKKRYFQQQNNSKHTLQPKPLAILSIELMLHGSLQVKLLCRICLYSSQVSWQVFHLCVWSFYSFKEYVNHETWQIVPFCSQVITYYLLIFSRQSLWF